MSSDKTSATPSTTGAASASATTITAQKPDQLLVSNLKGVDVMGSDDKKVGDITTELMNPSSRTIDRLVVSVGGVLGVGGHHVALPVNDFQWDGQRGGFKIAKTADDLKAMTQWKEAAASNR